MPNYTVNDVGDINEAYSQLAAITVVQASKDYLHLLLDSTPYKDNEHIATIVAHDGDEARKAIKKRLQENRNTVKECSDFLRAVMQCGIETIPKDKVFAQKCAEINKALDEGVDAEQMLYYATLYRLISTGVRTAARRRRQKYQQELKDVREFLTNGSVELYSGGRLNSGELVKLIEDKAEKVLRKRKKHEGVANKE